VIDKLRRVRPALGYCSPPKQGGQRGRRRGAGRIAGDLVEDDHSDRSGQVGVDAVEVRSKAAWNGDDVARVGDVDPPPRLWRTLPGFHCRPVALLCITDEAGQDNKAVCVPADYPRYEHMVDVTDLAASTKSRIEHFFGIYKQLEPGKSVASDMSWARRAAAETEIRTARDRARPRHC
jgi:hypothetical protein